MVTESENNTKSKNFTVENNVYIGEVVSYTSNYKSFGEMIWDSIKNNGNKIAHLDALTEEVVTYAELQDKIVRCALWLQEHGIKTDDVVTVCTNNHLNSIVPCLAASYINAIFNTWHEHLDLQTALHFLQLCEPKVIFCSKLSLDIIQSAIMKTNYDPIIVVFGNHPDAIPFANILNNYSNMEVANFRYAKLDNIKRTVCIIHSSGTTGMPKSVELSNYTLMMISIDQKFTAVTLWFTTLYWISGVVMNVRSITQGAKVIIYPEFDEEMTCKLIEKYEIVMLFLSTSMINRFLRAGYVKKYSLPSLRIIFGGGAILKPKSQEELRRLLPHVEILQVYGMTEVGGVAVRQNPNHKNGSCGTVVPNVQIKIVDPESGKVMEPNQSGEIWIRSKNMMNGYYKNPEATNNTVDKDGWLHSGDIGYIDSNGELFIFDKIKELMKYRNFQISPGEIEAVLQLHPGVLEVAVVAVPHATDDEHPLAYVSKKPGFKVTEKELIDLVASKMSDQYKLRAGVIFLDTFPYTGSGKIARKDLRAMAKKLEKVE
ncbi:uncharacterized protein [Linepithema humile]|uniref:uncharacterized protein n=1 Tax=Linepithema humile TaxID=83485 RepID=UPI0006232FD3|nr:PREDICTED: 4-coumarate--CoA ligase 1-like [Linepithema humile]